MNVNDAIAILTPHLAGAVRVCSNGYMSRAAFGAGDTEASFYMIGSMGLASSIGLGIALARPDLRVVVLDGDGNVLMNLGTLATIAARAPARLRHVCFDNGAHASTGAQPTISDAVHLDEVARAAGYRWTKRVETPDALGAEIPAFLAGPGPAFLLVRTVLGPPGPPGPRIPFTPIEMTTRLRRAMEGA